MSTLLTLGLANAVCAALLALVALIAGRFCRRPAVLHSLWLLVLLKLVTPPFWPITVAHLPEEPAPVVETTALPPSGLAAYTMLTPTSEVPFIPANEPDARPSMEAVTKKPVTVHVQKAATKMNETQAAPSLKMELTLAQQGPAPSEPAAAPSAPVEQPQGLASCVPLLGLAWLAGVVVWLVWAGRNIARFHYLLRHARRAGLEVQQQSDDLAARMGLSRGPEIWLLPGALPPLVWAALGRVRIFFPAKLLACLDDTERASLLAHELAHVRRRDHWVRWLELIASALYWWYPLVWLARRRLHVHEEECCDAWVIGEVPARTYAAAILNTLDFLAEDQAPLPVMASGLAGVELLKRRLSLIMDRNTPKRLSLSTRFIVVLAGLLLLSLRPNLARTETKPTQDNETKAPPAAKPEPAAPVPVEKSQDAESFLPNPSPLSGRSLTVRSVAFSPDGRFLVIVGGRGEAPGELRIWDVSKRRMAATVKADLPVRSAVFSPDGKNLATGEMDGTVKLREPTTGKVRATLSGHTLGVNSVAISTDGKTLAAAGLDKVVTVWDVVSSKQRLRLQKHTDQVLSVSFSPDGKTLASGSRDRNAILWDMETGKARTTLAGHANAIESVAFSSDGKTIATGSWDSTVKLWDVDTGKEQNTLTGLEGRVTCVAYSPDGKTLGAATLQGRIKLWDTATLKELATFENNTQGVWSLAFSLDGKRLATGGKEIEVKLWDVAGRKELTTVQEARDHLFEQQPVLALAASPDGKSLAIAGENGGVQLCDLTTGTQRHVLKGHDDVVTCLAFSPDGKLLATGSPDQKIKLWDAASGKEVRTLQGHTSWVYALAFSPGGKTLASGSYDKTIHLWDTETGKSLRVLKGHKASIRVLAFSPDGKTLASGSSDHTIRLWPMDAGGEPVVLKGHEDTVRALAFSPDGKTLASGSDDQTVKLWDVEKKSERATLKGAHNTEVTTLAFSPHGKTLVSGAAGGGIALWDPSTGTHRGDLSGHQPDAVTSVLVLPDGQRLLSAGLDRTVKIWQPAPSPVRLLRGHTGPVVSLVISRDGRRLLSGSGWPQGDKTARLWDFKTGKELRVFRAETPADNGARETSSQIGAVAFSPDGKQAVAAGASGVAFLWDMETGKEVRRFRGHVGEISALDFAPDGQHVLSGGQDKTIRLWEVKSGRLVRKFEGHTNWVRSVRFGRDGKRFLSGGRDGVMRLWDVDSGKQLRQFIAAPKGWTESVAWMPDNRQAVCAGGGSEVQIWDVESGEQVRSFKGHAYGVTCVDVSPDGRSILSCGYDWTIRLWDATTGQQRKIFRLPGFARVVKFSIDGRYAIGAGGGHSEGGGKYVPGGNDFPIRVWSLRDEQTAQTMKPKLP